MYKISNFQLYTLMMSLLGPIAFLEMPKRLIPLVSNTAWLAAVTAIGPGTLIMAMFLYIIRKSSSPFPAMLEEHLGRWIGKILGFLYFLIFLLVCSYTVRLFVDFAETNVLPGTPISVHVMLLVILGYTAIKAGFENFTRVCEIVVVVGLGFSVLVLGLVFIQQVDFSHLLPLFYIKPKPFSLAVLSASSVVGRTLPILTLAFFSNNPAGIRSVFIKSLVTYIILISITTMAAIVMFGGEAASIYTFPTFSMIRIINIGEFVQNIDIAFIGIWILGIFAALTIPWFMACFTLQQVFNLKDYRFIAGPTALIIGVLTIQTADNILELDVLTTKIIPVTYSFFFIIIPFFVFLRLLFKPDRVPKPSPHSTTSEFE